MKTDYQQFNILDFDKVCEKSAIAFANLQNLKEEGILPEAGAALAGLIEKPEDLPDLLAFLDWLFEEKFYKYYLLERPPMPGAFPNEKSNLPIEIIAFDEKRRIDEQEISVWGYVSYEKPLSLQEIEDYELAEEL